MKRVYYRYELWEDHKHKMFFPQSEPSGISAAYSILKDPERLYDAMYYVSHHWPVSAEMNLTNTNRNRQAWLGQAACCWMVHATEDETKAAWKNLTREEQDAANTVADRIILEWEAEYAKTQTRH
jgi:hypothetical protein